MTAVRSVLTLLLVHLAACAHALFTKEASHSAGHIMQGGADLSDKSYEKEFTVDLQVEEDNETHHGNMAEVLGLKLKGVKIHKIVIGGTMSRWNRDHPDSKVKEGDEISHVNNRTAEVLNDLMSTGASVSDGSLSLGVRRPRSAPTADANVSLALQRRAGGGVHFRSSGEEGPGQKDNGDNSGWEEFEAFETFRLAARIRALLKYWNGLFPEDQMETTEKGVGSALAWLAERRNNTDDAAVLERTATTAAALARADKEYSDEAIGAKMDVLRKVHSDVVLGTKMEVLLRYWNELFPQDTIDTTSKRFSRALKLLARTPATERS